MDETTLMQEEPAQSGSKRTYTRRTGGDEEITALRAQVARLTEIVEHVTAVPEDDDPYPLYEVGIGGYFSRDCVNYPPGSMFRDKTGAIIPNQEWRPLNEAAALAMAAYEATLPDKGLLTPKERDELIPQARIELRNVEFATDSEREDAVMKRAMYLKRKLDGGMTTLRGRPDPNIPMMSSVRIQQAYDPRETVGRHLPGGVRATPHPPGSETELYRGATPAANKTAPVFGNVQSQPLGTVGVG